jgi:hypothetical protein
MVESTLLAADLAQQSVKTLVMQEKPEEKKPIKKWVFHVKRDAKGNLISIEATAKD